MWEGWGDFHRQGQLCVFTRYDVKVTLVFWIAPTHVELDFFHINFNWILLYCNTFELADVVLRPYCCRLSEDCDDFPLGNVRVRDELVISTSESIVLDNPGFFCEAWQ